MGYCSQHTFDKYDEVATIARPPIEPVSRKPSAETTGYIVCSECSNSKEIGCTGHVSIVLVSLHKVRQRGVHCLFLSTPGLGTFWGISGKNPGPYELHPGPFRLLLRPSGHYMGAN